MSKRKVAVVFGSESDWPVLAKCVDQLRAFDVEPYVEVISAHRSPDRAREFACSAEEDGFFVIIAAAGLSNALAGAIAAHTCLPVIGVPLASGPLNGVDALLSTVQMPPGVPVAAVGIGDSGAQNAALLAVQILARNDTELAAAYSKYKADQAQAVAEKNRELQKRLSP